MKKEIVSIREMDKIEDVILKSQIGVLAFYVNDKMKQAASPFIYLDKNFYFIFDTLNDKEIQAREDINVSFMMQSEKGSEDSKFNYTEIICTGTIKKLDDKKKLDSICEEFDNKYSLCKDSVDFKNSIEENRINILMIDTEEFQASKIFVG